MPLLWLKKRLASTTIESLKLQFNKDIFGRGVKMADKSDLVLGLFAGFILGFLIGTWLTKSGLLGGLTAQPTPKQYGVKYNYDEKGRLTEVLPVPTPG